MTRRQVSILEGLEAMRRNSETRCFDEVTIQDSFGTVVDIDGVSLPLPDQSSRLLTIIESQRVRMGAVEQAHSDSTPAPRADTTARNATRRTPS